MKNLLRHALGLAALTIAALAGDALAADPVRLLFEPTSTTSVEPGRALELQIVGQDYAGNRVGFGGLSLVTSATDGSLDVLEYPFRWRFVAPNRTGSVQLRAWLRERPSVTGSLTVQVGSGQTSDRLVLRGPTNADFGTSVSIEVLAVRSDGATYRVRDQRILGTLEGPGLLESSEPGVFRYTAPSRSTGFREGRTARITAALERYPQVSGSLTLALTDSGPGPYPGPWTGPSDIAQLAVELPRDTDSLEFGQSVDVFVTATDSAGRRVDLGSRRVEMYATYGDVVPVTSSRFRYTAPTRNESPYGGAVRVQLRAWLRQTPDVVGTASLLLVTPRPYARLVVRGPSTVEPGRSVDLEVQGLRSDGRTYPVRDESISVTLEGPGTIQTASSGILRYTAPRYDLGWAHRTARVVAWLERYPETRGDLSISIEGAVVVTPPSQGGAVRLAFEFAQTRPDDRPVVESGEAIDVQVLAFDAAGNRAGVGWRRIETSASEGDLTMVESPDRFRFTAPTRVDRPRSVQLRAWLRQAPQVQTATSIDVVPRRLYDWLVLRGPSSVEPGGTVDVQVLGARPGGDAVPVNDPSLVVGVEGPGSVAPVAAGVWRYSAPSRLDSHSDGRSDWRSGGQVARIVASIPHYASLRGEMSVLITPPTPREELARIAFELPREDATVDPGRTIEFAILGQDESGRRVELGDRAIEVSATDGDVAVLQRPARIRFTAPTSMPTGSRTVQVRAWVKHDPRIAATAIVTVRSSDAKAYGSLELRGPGAIQLGTAADFEAWLTRRDGTSAPVTDQRVVVAVDGPGTVQSTGPGRFRYSAPPASDTRSSGRTVRFTASLERDPGTTGELAVALTRDAPSEEDAPGVLWPGGHVRLIAFRTKSARDEDWAPVFLPLPSPGRPLVAPQNWVRLRIEPQRDDIRKMELEWTVGDRPVRVDDSDPSGRLRLVKGRNGRTHALVETELPAGGRPLVLTLLQTTTTGEVLRDEFVVQFRPDARR